MNRTSPCRAAVGSAGAEVKVGLGRGVELGLGESVAVGGAGVAVGGTRVYVAVGNGVFVAVGGAGVGVFVGGCVGTGVAVSVGGAVVGVGAIAGAPVHPATNNTTTINDHIKWRDMMTSYGL